MICENVNETIKTISRTTRQTILMSDITDVMEATTTREQSILQFMEKHKDPVFTINELMKLIDFGGISISSVANSLNKLLKAKKLGKIKGKRCCDGDFYGLPEDINKVNEQLNRGEK